MSGSTQIVRRLRSGEFAPACSWDGLMASSIKQSPESRPVCERNHDVIRSMIADRESSAEIADRVGCSAVLLNRYIRKVPELRSMRLKFKCKKKSAETSSWTKYLEMRPWIMAALKTRSVDAVAKEIKLSHCTLRWYLAKDEIEELRAEVEQLREDAERYRYLRDRDLDTIIDGGIFVGVTPANVVISGDNLDLEIDTAMKETK